MDEKVWDVVILGGGLAGTTLAIQLKQARPSTEIVVIEKLLYPVPETAFKVGESTIEGGAYYLRKVVGMDAHIREHELVKMGLRFFMSQGDNSQIERRVEFGPHSLAKITGDLTSCQLDRGRFENALQARAVSLGVDYWDGSKVKAITLG
ncbi:MAG TPA: tryptophan 7-halogenase, partial [Anaerolineae bacterium]|nr:tryptophan 7-halogenase [Anaerolineae bacterium]